MGDERVYTFHGEVDAGVVRAFDFEGTLVFETVLPTAGQVSGGLALGSDGLFVRGSSIVRGDPTSSSQWIARIEPETGELL